MIFVFFFLFFSFFSNLLLKMNMIRFCLEDGRNFSLNLKKGCSFCCSWMSAILCRMASYRKRGKNKI